MSLTVIFIIITVVASLYAWNNSAILQGWMLNPYSVKRRSQYYRFITSGLIHNDYMHLIFNMLALYLFGGQVERIYQSAFGDLGLLLYAALYILGIIVSDIPTYLKHQDQPHYNSLGASGGVSSVIFSAILFNPLNEICLYFVLCAPGFILGIGYLIYSYMQAKRGGDYINHDAHLYGSVFGVIFTVILIPAVIPSFLQQIMSWRLF